MNSNMRTSPKGKTFLKNEEGVRYEAYLDTGGVWTNGVGHTGPDVYEGQVVDEAQVDAWLTEDLKEAEDAVHRLVKVPLTQNQFDVLVSFLFNLGETQVAPSTLIRKLNAGDYAGAANQFTRWVYDNGVIVPGLVNRRRRDRVRFLEQ